METRNFDAEIILMHDASVGQRQNCWVFGDKLTSGHHPFPDGKWIDTSPVAKIAEENGEKYLITRSGSVYKVIGEGLEDYETKLYGEPPKQGNF